MSDRLRGAIAASIGAAMAAWTQRDLAGDAWTWAFLGSVVAWFIGLALAARGVLGARRFAWARRHRKGVTFCACAAALLFPVGLLVETGAFSGELLEGLWIAGALAGIPILASVLVAAGATGSVRDALATVLLAAALVGTAWIWMLDWVEGRVPAAWHALGVVPTLAGAALVAWPEVAGRKQLPASTA